MSAAKAIVLTLGIVAAMLIVTLSIVVVAISSTHHSPTVLPPVLTITGCTKSCEMLV